MTEPPRITWLVERSAKAGELRIGLLGRALIAELAGKRVPLEGNDMASLAELASSRRTAHLLTPLRDGGYTHLLGGKIALLPGEAPMLQQVLLGTPEGLRTRRAALLAMVAREAEAETGPAEVVLSGIAHHAEESEAQVGHARRMLMDFDRAFPSVRGGA